MRNNVFCGRKPIPYSSNTAAIPIKKTTQRRAQDRPGLKISNHLGAHPIEPVFGKYFYLYFPNHGILFWRIACVSACSRVVHTRLETALSEYVSHSEVLPLLQPCFPFQDFWNALRRD